MAESFSTVILKAVSFCNLQCTYCSAHCSEHVPRQISPDSIFAVFRELAEAGRISLDCKILWHGGEPSLTAPETADSIMSRLENIAQEYKIKLHFIMQSNGFQYSSAWLNLFQKFHIALGISCDGPEQIHNQCRKTSFGAGSYKQIEENITVLQKLNIPVSLLCVIDSRQEQDVQVFFRWAAEKKLPVKLNPLFYDNMSAEDFRKYFDFLREFLICYLQSKEDFPVEPVSGMFQAILANAPYSECSFSGNCGKHILCIDYNGCMSSCGRLSDFPGHAIPVVPGKAVETAGLLQTQMAKASSERMELLHCEKCRYFKFCHAGCSAYLNLNNAVHYCAAIRNFWDFMNGEALLLLKRRLLREREFLQNQLDDFRSMAGMG